jgi:hypothetical protein
MHANACLSTRPPLQVQLPSVPAFMAVLGLWDIECRVTVACRDGRIYTIKNGTVGYICIYIYIYSLGHLIPHLIVYRHNCT